MINTVDAQEYGSLPSSNTIPVRVLVRTSLALVLLSAPEVASARCAGGASFLEWAGWVERTCEKHVVGVGTVVDTPERAGMSGFDTLIRVDEVIRGALVVGQIVRIQHHPCVNIGFPWERNTTIFFGGQPGYDGGLISPPCAPDGLRISGGDVYDERGKQVGTREEVTRVLRRSSGLMDRLRVALGLVESPWEISARELLNKGYY